MKEDSEKAKSLASKNSVKLHVFEPSMREIWTVVGRGDEHWISPDGSYCSCRGFFFGTLQAGNKERPVCYHLESASIARENDQIEIIIFSDEEYRDFLLGLISDL